MNPAILHTTSFLQTHFNIILPFTLYLSGLFPFTFPDYCFYGFLIRLKSATCPTNPTLIPPRFINPLRPRCYLNTTTFNTETFCILLSLSHTHTHTHTHTHKTYACFIQTAITSLYRINCYNAQRLLCCMN